MTVGQPEINLNSWGIRYVKVKQSPTAELDKEPKEGDKREVSTGGLSDLDASTSTFPDRQEDSKGDKDSHIRTADQTEKEKELNRGGSPQSVTSVNTPLKEVEGQLQTFDKPKYGVGSVATGSTQGGKGTKTLTTGQHGTQTGKKGVPKFDAPKQSEVSGHVGSNVGYDSGIKSPDADKKRVSGKGKPTVFKKPKEGEGGTAESGAKFDEAHAKRMRKAIMDMNIAILKCKNFKMKRIAYSSGGDFGRRYPSRYGDENTHDAGIDDLRYSQRNSQAVQSKTETLAPDRKDETEVSSYGEGATGQHGKEGDKKLNVEGKVVDTNNEKPRTSVKSDEIVAKAIELINEAYDQIGKGKNVEETQDKYRDEFDSIDQDNPQEVDEEEFNSLGYQKELKERENSQKGDSEEVVPRAYEKLISERIRREKSQKGDSEEDNLEDLNNNMKVTGQALDTLGSALDSRKKDSAVTTGTEGTNNPVNAGEKESFGKTLDTQGRKDEYTPEEHAEHDSQKAEKDDPYHVSEYLDSLTTRERDERNNTWRPHPDDNTPKDDY